MPQIAQQDYIRIPIGDTGNLTSSEKSALKKQVANGTIFDVLLEFEETKTGRVLSVDTDSQCVVLLTPEDGSVILLEYGE